MSLKTEKLSQLEVLESAEGTHVLVEQDGTHKRVPAAMIGGGGAGIDVTATVGQTIVVTEVDASGKPTKWEAADYQPRTHWTGAKVLVPEHTFEAGISGSNMAMHGDIKLLGLTVGKTYTVVFDGVTYTCVAETGQVTQDGVNMLDIISIGNLGMFGGTDNGLPFILGDLPFYNNGNWMCLPYVYGEHTLSIVDNAGVYPIPVQYVTNALPYYIEVTGSGTDDDPYVCSTLVEDAVNAAKSGRSVVMREMGYYQSTLVVTRDHYCMWFYCQTIGDFAAGQAQFMSDSTLGRKVFNLFPKDDGTYEVQKVILS